MLKPQLPGVIDNELPQIDEPILAKESSLVPEVLGVLATTRENANNSLGYEQKTSLDDLEIAFLANLLNIPKEKISNHCYSNDDLIEKHLNSISLLSHKLSVELIGLGYGNAIARNLEKVEEISRKEIVLKLLETYPGGLSYAVKLEDSLRKYKKVEGVDKEIALRLISWGHGDVVLRIWENIEGVDQEVVMRQIESKLPEGSVERLQLTEVQNFKEWLLKLLNEEYIDYVSNLKHFPKLDKECALKYIELGKTNLVAKYIQAFEGLDTEIALVLIRDRFAKVVIENDQKFGGLNEEIRQALLEA